MHVISYSQFTMSVIRSADTTKRSAGLLGRIGFSLNVQIVHFLLASMVGSRMKLYRLGYTYKTPKFSSASFKSIASIIFLHDFWKAYGRHGRIESDWDILLRYKCHRRASLPPGPGLERNLKFVSQGRLPDGPKKELPSD